MLNLSIDRYRFAVGLGAALLRGHTSLLPPNHVADTVARLRARFAGVYALVEGRGRRPRPADGPPRRRAPAPAPAIDRHSGDRSRPGRRLRADLGLDRRAGAARQALGPARPQRAGRGEPPRRRARAASTSPASPSSRPCRRSTCTASSRASCSRCTAARSSTPSGRSIPADIVAALAAPPAPRVLVTTPFHLKTVLDAGLRAAAARARRSARPRRCRRSSRRAPRQRLGAPLLEIYGCTEAGQVASRRTTAGAEWRTFDGVRSTATATAATVSGGHVPQPTRARRRARGRRRRDASACSAARTT